VVAAIAGVLHVNDLAITRMRQLVMSLRSFGRPDMAQRDRVDLHETIDAALALLRHELKDRVEVRREYGSLPLLDCYPQQLSQAFMNLLLNAVQAIPGRGSIMVRTLIDGGGVMVEIEDTGAGIPVEHVARIFEPGFTTKGARVGMGLGLLITQQIVDQHGGRIAVRSTPGVGTTFTVHLPASTHA
jgi:two-component system NtrC family sensor kinase